MNKKFRIVICSGTTCYVLGGAQLMMLEDVMPADLKDQVEIVGSTCLQACRDGQSQPPFVKINDHLMSEASISRIVEYLRQH